MSLLNLQYVSLCWKVNVIHGIHYTWHLNTSKHQKPLENTGHKLSEENPPQFSHFSASFLLLAPRLHIPEKHKDKGLFESHTQINIVAPRLNNPRNWHEIASSCLISGGWAAYHILSGRPSNDERRVSRTNRLTDTLHMCADVLHSWSLIIDCRFPEDMSGPLPNGQFRQQRGNADVTDALPLVLSHGDWVSWLVVTGTNCRIPWKCLPDISGRRNCQFAYYVKLCIVRRSSCAACCRRCKSLR